jgi:ankyrin repeat protein
MLKFVTKLLRPQNPGKLFHAITYEKLDLAKALLASGYDANAIDEFGQNPLFRIVYNKYLTQIEFLQLFIAYGADVNFRKPDGATVDIINDNGATPMHYVSEAEDAAHFITLGLDINAKDNRGSTLLHSSVYGECTLVNYCIISGADVNARDKNGWTPLMYLARTEYVTEKGEIAQQIAKALALLEAGADIHATDNENKKAHDHALFFKNNVLADWLSSKEGTWKNSK